MSTNRKRKEKRSKGREEWKEEKGKKRVWKL